MTDEYPKVTRVLALENKLRVDYLARENYTAQVIYTPDGAEHLDGSVSVDENVIAEQVKDRLNQTKLVE